MIAKKSWSTGSTLIGGGAGALGGLGINYFLLGKKDLKSNLVAAALGGGAGGLMGGLIHSLSTQDRDQSPIDDVQAKALSETTEGKQKLQTEYPNYLADLRERAGDTGVSGLGGITNTVVTGAAGGIGGGITGGAAGNLSARIANHREGLPAIIKARERALLQKARTEMAGNKFTGTIPDIPDYFEARVRRRTKKGGIAGVGVGLLSAVAYNFLHRRDADEAKKLLNDIYGK